MRTPDTQSKPPPDTNKYYGPKAEKVYLRKVDEGTPNACWIVCAKGDPGAVLFTPAF